MATRIRLRRMGANKRPFFRVVVADQRAPRDGRFIEVIGKYHPMADPSLIEIDEDRALHWLRVGAQPSNQVLNLFRKSGVWDRFAAERPSALKQRAAATDRSGKPAEPKQSKKAQARAKESASTAAAAVEAPVAAGAGAADADSSAEEPVEA
jgi:small subunit ribosomal protein S16